MEALLSKAKALEDEGITTYIYTGCYTLPFKTLTGSVQSDLILIDKVIGVGEIAISDHRSSQPNLRDLEKLAAHTRVGGLLSKKAGIVHLHLGEGPDGIKYLMEIVRTTEIPIKQFMPTHINRVRHLVEQSMEFIKMGGFVDLTSDFYKSEKRPDCMSIGDTLKLYLENGMPLDHVCASSDANGSMPVFDENEDLVSIDVGCASVLFKDIRSAIQDGIVNLEQGLSLITQNPAKALKLYPRKGTIRVKSDADIVLLDSDLNIHTVIAKGHVMVKNYEAVVKGYFEGAVAQQ
jgi:beta-aspartyl-dipeptidase (metallo-type)